ncbi:MAG: glycosyltransferase family 9 protein [Candidatus Omnitrophica bacterium]|nr:glycosyltransferase family 9 protein [Candidatus Omnitrophota bacterium]
MAGRKMRVLLIELSNLGDAVLTYPAIGSLWKAYPGGEFHVLAGPRSAPLFREDPRFNRVWVLEKGADVLDQISMVAGLFLQRFDLVVDFRHSLIPLFLFTRRTKLLRRPPPDPAHRVFRHLKVVADLGLDAPEAAVPLFYGPEDEREVARRLKPGAKTMVISPGSRSHLKRWPPVRFAAVADRLAAEEGMQPVLVGSPEEGETAQAVTASMRQEALDFTGDLTFRQLAALLSRASLCVTHDSAILHMAQAMNTPTLALFGPTDEAKYGPRNPNSLVVRKRVACAPCERALCPYGHECLQWLSADEVFEAALQVLRGVPSWAAAP